MREKLIELLWKYDQMRMMRMRIEECADHLIANGVTIQKWIPVTERLPETGIDVIAYMDNSIESRIVPAMYGKNRNKYYWWDCIFNTELLSVTHWMPLPEPPGEK